jgi:hypothetical protein
MTTRMLLQLVICHNSSASSKHFPTPFVAGMGYLISCAVVIKYAQTLKEAGWFIQMD